MLLYGDPQFQRSLADFAAQVAHLCAGLDRQNLDVLRSALIQAGQLEQGIHDSTDSDWDQRSQAVRVTDCLARAFVLLFLEGKWKESEIAGALSTLRALATGSKDLTLIIKVPEGFEFYALYPEQYCLSTLKWLDHHQTCARRHALLVGIRSIGTTLSAVVKATLESRGWQATRCTVRPTGHPFTREVELPVQAERFAPESPSALIVDEGPGISGSSMAAAAKALRNAGITDISFLPGHGGEPGSAATPEIRQWWKEIPAYFRTLEELAWSGQSLADLLLQETKTLAQPPQLTDEMIRRPGSLESSEARWIDFSCGLWRSHVFSKEEQWPPVASFLERTKYFCTTERVSVLWKFDGLGSAREHCAALARDGSHSDRRLPSPMKKALGFSAEPWIHGRRLTQCDGLNAAILRCIADHIISVSGPPLDDRAASESLDRLKEMLICNARDGLGQELGHMAEALCNDILEPPLFGSYGDGRLAPFEWVETTRGSIYKTDSRGHVCDHTLVGRQSILWDVAGALVEWDFGDAEADYFLHLLAQKGVTPDAMVLRFYVLSYSAFRLGLWSIFTEHEPLPSPDHLRIEKAKRYYQSWFKTTLLCPARRMPLAAA